MGKGYWRLVEGKPPLPDNSSVEQVEAYEQKGHAALETMMNAFNDKILGVATSSKTPKELWERLKAKYEAAGASVDSVIEQYQVTDMVPGESVIDYEIRLNTLETRLASMGKEIDEDEKIRALLRGLTKKFESTVEAIRWNKKTRGDAVEMLVTKEGDLREKGMRHTTEHPEARALITREGVICYGCGRNGHYDRECANGEGEQAHNGGRRRHRKGRGGR